MKHKKNSFFVTNNALENLKDTCSRAFLNTLRLHYLFKICKKTFKKYVGAGDLTIGGGLHEL